MYQTTFEPINPSAPKDLFQLLSGTSFGQISELIHICRFPTQEIKMKETKEKTNLTDSCLYFQICTGRVQNSSQVVKVPTAVVFKNSKC